MGQQRSSRPRNATSGPPRSTDIVRAALLIRSVPVADLELIQDLRRWKQSPLFFAALQK